MGETEIKLKRERTKALIDRGVKGFLSTTLSMALASTPFVSAIAMPIDFQDSDKSQWYASALDYVSDKGYMTGYGNTGIFGIGRELTRAEFAQILTNISGEKGAAYDTTGLEDLRDTSEWFTPAANNAVQKGYIRGYDGKVFAPYENITREQATTIMYRYTLQLKLNSLATLNTTDETNNIKVTDDTKPALESFKDGQSVSDWAQDGINWAINKGVIEGRNVGGEYLIDPQAPILREEIAAIIERWQTKVIDALGTENNGDDDANNEDGSKDNEGNGDTNQGSNNEDNPNGGSNNNSGNSNDSNNPNGSSGSHDPNDPNNSGNNNGNNQGSSEDNGSSSEQKPEGNLEDILKPGDVTIKPSGESSGNDNGDDTDPGNSGNSGNTSNPGNTDNNGSDNTDSNTENTDNSNANSGNESDNNGGTTTTNPGQINQGNAGSLTLDASINESALPEGLKAEDLAYQWYRLVDNEWVPIDGATSPTYKTSPVDGGHKLAVKITDPTGRFGGELFIEYDEIIPKSRLAFDITDKMILSMRDGICAGETYYIDTENERFPEPAAIDFIWYLDGEKLGQGASIQIPADAKGKTLKVVAVDTTGIYEGEFELASAQVETERITGILTLSGDRIPGGDIQLTALNVDEKCVIEYAFYIDGVEASKSSDGTWRIPIECSGATISACAYDTTGYRGGKLRIEDFRIEKPSLSSFDGGVIPVKGKCSVLQTIEPDISALPSDGKYMYTWFLDDKLIYTGETPSLSIPIEYAGKTIKCNITDTSGRYDGIASTGKIRVSSNSLEGEISIIGSGIALETLTAVVDGVQTDTALEIKWIRDGKVLSKGSSYVPQGTDVGKTITVEVTDTSNTYGGNLTKSIQITGRPLSEELQANDITVDGSASVGDTISASIPEEKIPAGFIPQYQWTKDGEIINGATSSTYTLTLDDSGHEIAVIISDASGIYDGAIASPPQTVTKRPLSGSVTVSGSVEANNLLIATLSEFPSSAIASYSWMRDDGAITASTKGINITTDDIGHRYTVTVSDARGYYLGSLTATTNLITSPALINNFAATISGTPSVGNILTCTIFTLNNSATVGTDYRLTYQWLKDDEIITGATNPTLPITSAYNGSKIRCRISDAYDVYTGSLDSDPLTIGASNNVSGSELNVTYIASKSASDSTTIKSFTNPNDQKIVGNLGNFTQSENEFICKVAGKYKVKFDVNIDLHITPSNGSLEETELFEAYLETSIHGRLTQLSDLITTTKAESFNGHRIYQSEHDLYLSENEAVSLSAGWKNNKISAATWWGYITMSIISTD